MSDLKIKIAILCGGLFISLVPPACHAERVLTMKEARNLTFNSLINAYPRPNIVRRVNHAVKEPAKSGGAHLASPRARILRASGNKKGVVIRSGVFQAHKAKHRR